MGKSNVDKFKSSKLKFWGPPFPKSSFHPRSVVDSCVGNLNKRVFCVSDSCLKYKSKLANNRINVRLWQFRIYAISDWPRPANILSCPRHLCTVWLRLEYQCLNKDIEIWIRFHKYLNIATFLHYYTPLAVMPGFLCYRNLGASIASIGNITSISCGIGLHSRVSAVSSAHRAMTSNAGQRWIPLPTMPHLSLFWICSGCAQRCQ